MPPSELEIATLYEQYAHVVFHRARSILGNDELAQDAVQETFARVIHHWESFRGEAAPLTWMYRITTNWCLNQIRNRRGHDDKHTVYRGDIMGDGVTWQKPADEAALVRRMLASEDPQTRQIVLHIYFDDMTREETARQVGLSVPTVRKRLNLFLKKAHRKMTLPPATLAVLTALCLGGVA